MKQAFKMKYWLCKVAIILFLGGFATELHAEDKFYIPNFGIAAGETKQVAIQFDSDNISSTDPAKLEYVAFQFDLQLPEGLTVAQKNGNYDFAYNTDRSDNHTFSSALQADGGIRVLSASLTNAKFSGTSGDFIYFSVTASDDFVGNQEIALKNIMFSTKSGRTNLENTTAEVSLLKRYKVTYMVDGAEYKTEEVVNGSPITLIAAPTKEGYTFSGWTDAPAIMPAEDITINGTFAVNSYKVTYMVDGAAYKTENVVYGSSITLVAAPTKEGYTFSGWSEAPATMPAKDITINGTFAVNSYKVTYKVDGAEYKTVNVNFGEKIVLIDAPTKDGFTFSGWTDAPETMPAKDIVINGKFLTNAYSVTYMVDGKEYRTIQVSYGAKIELIDAPTKEGYTFSGWKSEHITMPAKDITINGTFAVNSYKVTYMVDGAEYKTENVAYGSKITLVAAPTKEGHTFSGWTDAPESMPAKDITINGTFSINSYKITYMVDGTEYQSATVVYGSEITLIAAPTKEGYTFSGWSEAPATMPAKDITINGTFAVNSYKVTYMVDGAEYKTENVAYGSAITLVAAPTKEGYTFSGWSEAPATMPAEDITISGTFAVNYYTLTYIVDGEVYKEEQVAYGSEIVLLDAPIKDDYVFSGWSDSPVTMPAENVTITGSFVHTSISGVSSDATIKVDGNCVTVSGANNCSVAVYTVSGALVEKIDSYAGEEITLDKGIYVVRVGEKIIKIKL